MEREIDEEADEDGDSESEEPARKKQRMGVLKVTWNEKIRAMRCSKQFGID